jgi:hypothetical protein
MISKSNLGGVNEVKNYYLFPHYRDYFAVVKNDIEELRKTEFKNLAKALQDLVFNVLARIYETFEDFEEALKKVASTV